MVGRLIGGTSYPSRRPPIRFRFFAGNHPPGTTMKNQYFGDINDYRKYGLLRVLQSTGSGRLLVAWMLTPDDGSADGGFRSYLEKPEVWMRYDTELFTGLAGLLQPGCDRAVSLMERSTLLPRTSYYSAVVPDAAKERDAWRRGLLVPAGDADLVFVDPDNGIEVPSKPVGRKGSSKYVTWQEIGDLWATGCSVLIYQHFRRERRAAFTERMASELREHTGARVTVALRTPHVLFLLAAQERHAAEVREAVARLSHRWSGQIEPMPPAG
jgi:hypothetical protein